MRSITGVHRALAGLTLAAALGVTLAASPTAGGADGVGDFHLKLDRSAPAADSTVQAPVEELRFWFSQPPQLEPTTVRLLGPGEVMVELGAITATADDASILFAPVVGETPPGTYRVIWRTMATDGHVVRGDFSFTVEAGVTGSG